MKVSFFLLFNLYLNHNCSLIIGKNTELFKAFSLGVVSWQTHHVFCLCGSSSRASLYKLILSFPRASLGPLGFGIFPFKLQTVSSSLLTSRLQLLNDWTGHSLIWWWSFSWFGWSLMSFSVKFVEFCACLCLPRLTAPDESSHLALWLASLMPLLTDLLLRTRSHHLPGRSSFILFRPLCLYFLLDTACLLAFLTALTLYYLFVSLCITSAGTARNVSWVNEHFLNQQVAWTSALQVEAEDDLCSEPVVNLFVLSSFKQAFCLLS